MVAFGALRYVWLGEARKLLLFEGSTKRVEPKQKEAGGWDSWASGTVLLAGGKLRPANRQHGRRSTE